MKLTSVDDIRMGSAGEYVFEGQDVHSQFALVLSYRPIVSILLRPWEVAKMVLGSTPNSAPILIVD